LRSRARFSATDRWLDAPASDSAMAIACFRLRTLPPFPRGNSPCLNSCITRSTVPRWAGVSCFAMLSSWDDHVERG